MEVMPTSAGGGAEEVNRWPGFFAVSLVPLCVGACRCVSVHDRDPCC